MTLNPTIALVGNPNAGKSTIFNALTGSNQHVGNWPGKTVERKEGAFTAEGLTLTVVDLPGTYSLSPFSPEEKVARDYLLDAQPDAAIAVVDAGNLERNLYLVVQILELGIPVIVALNMLDMAQARGLRIDVDRLAARLHVPVVRTIATRGEGLDTLQCTAARIVRERIRQPHHTHALKKGATLEHHELPRCPKCG